MVVIFITGILKDCRTKELILLHRLIIVLLQIYFDTKIRVEVFESCLKQDKLTFNHLKVVNIYIVYEIIMLANISKYKYSSNDNYPTLGKASFGVVSLTKNADVSNYKYSGYGSEFDRRSSFSHPSGEDGQNVIIFGVDMNSSTKIDNRKKIS